MDSWTLQGDSYSFLRSAPRTFSLCHRDGTPNHVEIFDIINVPTERSAISETTCLCDIFGDDCESPSHSSSPAVGAFVPSQREVDRTVAASPLVDDLNDSSGSYHTAQGSSEGEEGFEDSRERLYSPLSQNESSEKGQSEGGGLSLGHTDIFEDSSPNLEPKSKSPVTQLSIPPSEDLNTYERTPSPAHNSSYIISPEKRASPLSSSSVEKRHSPSLSNLRQVHSEAEQGRITPSIKDRLNSPTPQSLTPSPSSESRNCVSSSSSESVNIQSSPEFRVAQNSPEPKSSHINQQSSHSPKNFSSDFTESGFESRAAVSTPRPSSTSTELLSQSRVTLASPELKRPCSPDTQASSPFSEQQGSISLPDLFTRGSTPDIEEPCSPELISDSSAAGRNTSVTPESQTARLSVEPGSTASTPAPRYTPPSPVISIATTPELIESSVSPELRHTAPSPALLSAAFPAKTGTRTPSPGFSPKIRHISSPSEINIQVLSPVVSYSLSPSPEVRSNCSPVEHRHTAPSPEIRITASSPELHFDSASSRSLTSSPHITGISYTVVQPMDRDTPPFPELCHLPTPEPERTPVFPESRSPTQRRDSVQSSIAESTGSPRDSPHISDFSSPILHPAITLLHQPRHQTPSPQPKHHSHSPELRYQTPSSDKHQSPSPQHLRSRDRSTVSPSPEQISPATLPTEYHPHPTPSLRSTPEVDRADIAEIQYPENLAKDGSPSFALGRGDKSILAEIKSSSPVVADCLPVFTSPSSAKEKIESSLKEQSTEREVTPTEVNSQHNSSLVSFSEDTGHRSFREEETDNNPPIKTKSLSPNIPVSKDRSPTISPVPGATSDSPVQRLENPHPQFTTYSLTSETSSSIKSPCIPKPSRRRLPTQARRENRERLTEDMAHHVNRRRTPSPPLTRFTPVHIIAPEKPYRQWQNRSRSPSRVVASSPSGNLKKVVTSRESTNVALVDNNSQAHWVRLGGQLEKERELQLEEEKELGRERQRDREMERERKREEQVPEKGEGWQGDASYRGEQVELSFNARNRKGPASHNAAPTSRDTRQGLPTVHSYSESLLATRQLQQQQSLLRRVSQQDTRGGGPSRRLQPPAHQNKNSGPGRVAGGRPCRSSSSSMGSELDEADHEVKWFTDLAFHSLSSPEVDYLDMYNSSHHSSANISQPSTQESPAGVNAAWPAYADFSGSASKLDSDELSFQQSSAYYSDGLDPSRRYEMGSFECVDVAVEREDTRKVRRGVPKRQIQLKRKDNAEGRQDESSENSSPGIPAMMESPSPKSNSRETFMRQYSTPAATQDCYPSEHSPEPDQKSERKCKLQKSASLDETCSKTKMATCLIKSVLSKKMQSVDKQTDEHAEEMSPAFEESSPPTESVVTPLKGSPRPETHNLSSSLSSDYGLSSDGFLVRGEPSTRDDVKPSKSFGARSSNRPSSSSSSRSVNFSQTDSEEADSQSRNAISLKSEMRSEFKMQFDSEQSTTSVRVDDIKTWDEREGGDSANSTAGNTGAPSATRASSTQARMTNRDQECENKEDQKHLQQDDKGAHNSKTQEITLKAVEKKKASLSVCLTPEAENKCEFFSPEMTFKEKSERMETSLDEKTEGDEENGNNKVKAPIHKVRDVRRLVKNTYNLSFKATSSVMPSDVNAERMEIFNGERREEVKEERRKEIIAGEEQEVRQEMSMGEKRQEREEEYRVERKVEQKDKVKDSKLLTESPPPQSKVKTQSRPQPMQIEYKAVCWKEGKNKMSCNTKDSENLCDKSRPSPELVAEVSRVSQKSSTASTHRDTAIFEPCQQDLKKAAEKQEVVTEIQKVPDKEGEAVVVKTDRKPPMLGSLPKLPSKEREVSTAVVLIRDGSSKTKASASPAQEEIHTPVPPASLSPGPGTPGSTSGSSSHSVSMLLKEKGYQADIGAVVSNGQNTAEGKFAPRKHVNCLEIPLQTTMPSDGRIESRRERTFSLSSTTAGPSTDTITKTTEDDGVCIKPSVKDPVKQKSTSPLRNTQEQTPPLTKPKDQGDFESVKKVDPTFPPRSPAVRRFRPQAIEVKSLSKDIQKQEKPPNSTGNNRPQTIEVKSIAKNSQKPVVPPKPTCKFKPADLGTTPNEAQRLSATISTVKPQGEERPQTIVVSSPTIYRKISSESTSTSNYTRKLAVSAVSSLKPPPSKTTATTISNLTNQSTAPSETSNDRGQQQQPAASPQSSRYTQRPTTIAPTSSTCTVSTSAPGPVRDPIPNQITEPPSAGANQPRQPAVMDPDSQPQYPRMAYPHEQAMPVTSNTTKQPATVPATQLPGYTHQPCRRSLSSERHQRTDDLCFYSSDDPPSYDERESFSPLMLPDLTPRRSNNYQPSSRPPPCSCTAGCPSHPGLTPPHQHRSPNNLTPPAPSHSPGQTLPYPMAQPPLRPHQCRSDPQPMSYQRSSPKSSPLNPSQALYQPLHQPPPCPPHPSLMQACNADRQLQPPQHIDPRRPPLHRSPHQQPPGMAGAPYSDPGHSHSPGLAPMDPQYLSGPQSLGPSYGSEYGGDTSSLYSESNYGQTPRRVLLDPETGKYFYIEVPVQPLRKMLFDPETGQYVEVLIPQQAMSHSGLYPPSAVPYPSLHNPNMYAPAPQYMPYAAPPPSAHPQAQPQPPRYPEAAAATTMHPSAPGVSYRNHSGQGPKPEPQNNPPLDQSYLESMYYVPIGMNASPNPTPPDYYHKHPPNLPPTGGKRS